MEEDLEKVVEESSPVIIPELILDLKRTKLNYGQLKKGMVTNIGVPMVMTRIIYNSQEKNEAFDFQEFYSKPEMKELFVFEEGNLGKEKAYLVETALKFGRVEISKNLLTVDFDETIERKFRLFYQDSGEKKVFDPKQFGAKFVLEGNPKEKELLVLRRGCLMIGDNQQRFAYLAVFDEQREGYLLDKEESVFKRFKNFCRNGNY